MLKGLSLIDLAKKIESNKALKKDMIVDTGRLQMTAHTEGDTPKLVLPDVDGLGWQHDIQPLAHDQIGARAGIPAKYYDRMMQEAPHLLVENVNHWFHANPERRMVRTMDGDVRAFLSDRYQRIEHEEIAEVALPVLMNIPDVKIVSCEITDRRLYIQAVSPRVEGEIKKGDVVQAGVVISNSEVGAGAVSVRPMIYRLVCLNGMIAAEGFKAYHVGRRIEDTAELWRDDTRKADDRAVLLKVRDMVSGAVDQTRFAAQMAKMRALTEIEAPSVNVAGAVEVLAAKVGATQDEGNSILAALIKGGDLSAWGMLNAVTAQAHVAKSYDRAVEFEAAGGQLLELKRSEWQHIMTGERRLLAA